MKVLSLGLRRANNLFLFSFHFLAGKMHIKGIILFLFYEVYMIFIYMNFI